MKYGKIIYNTFIISALIALLPTCLMAQTNSVSPYSAYGLGEITNPFTPKYHGMGGTSAANFDPYSINVQNPASYGKLKMTTLEVGMYYTSLNQQQNDVQIDNSTANFNYMLVSVPIFNKLSLTAGLLPYTVRGFNNTQVTQDSDLGTITQTVRGSGGVNQVVLGGGWNLYKGLSVGINGRYFFGSNMDIETLQFNDVVFSNATRKETESRINAWTLEYGVLYTQGINDYDLTLGGTYRQMTQTNLRVSSYNFTYRPSPNNPVALDTLESQTDSEVEASLAPEFSIGLHFGKRGEKEGLYAWAATAEIKQYMGSEYINPTSRGTFINSLRYAGGFSIIPNQINPSISRTPGFWKRTEYRIGGFYEEGSLVANNNQINSFGTTFGLGVPLRNRGLAPGEAKENYLNLSVSVGRRGTLENNLVQENFVQLLFGITLSDKWFIKYKYR